jgi:uncharacterized protein YlaI
MAELITMYMARRNLINAAFNNRVIVCPECHGKFDLPVFTRINEYGMMIFDYREPERCEKCDDRGTIIATETNVSKKIKEKIITGYLKNLRRQEHAKKTTGQTWNRNRIKNDPRFK